MAAGGAKTRPLKFLPMPERSDYKSGRSGGGYNGGNGGGFGGNAFGNASGAGGPLGALVPPHSIEAEQSTLGAMLIERAAVEKVFEILEKDDFYRDAHQTIFDVISFLTERDEPIDFITVQNELKNRDRLDSVGGIAYLTALFDTVPTAANVEYYAKIVEEKATLRRLISASLEIIGSARGEVEDVGEVLDEAERSIFSVSQQRATAYFSSLKTLLLSVYDKAAEQSETKTQISGLSTGIHDFDMITSGLQNTDLIIVAARPSMGKTSLCLSIAEHVALKEHKPVAIFSLEMSKEQLALRMLCSQAQINSHRLRTGHLNEDEWGDLANVVQRMYEAPIFIDDATETSALTMRSKCRRLMAEHGLGLIVVDYLQLMRSHRRTENRVQEIGEIARGLKSLGRELKVPVIALSQLSRAVESRENKRPMLSDLRECVVGDTRLMNAATGMLVPIREVQAGNHILAMDSRQKVRPFEVERVWSTGIKPVFTLKTRTGRSITATANHPLLTAQGWKTVTELQAGDIIATAMRLPEHGREMPERADLCRLLGYLVGDGTFQTHRAIGFCGSDPVVVKDAIDIVMQYFPEVTWREKKRYGDYQEGDFRCLYENGYGKPYGNPLREWLRGLGILGQKDNTKHIPSWVWEAGQIGAAQFLAGYLSADGCVKQVVGRGWFVHFDTVSRQLAEDVQLLLLRLGVIATINDGYRSKKATQLIYRVSVAGFAGNLKRFVAAVHPGGRKGALLERMVTELTESVTNGSLFGLPPEISGLLFDKSKHLRQQGRKLKEGPRLYWKPQGKRPRRDICAKFAESLKDELLSVWANSDLLWEEIKSITPSGEEEVFDITVPGCANFIANGIIAHNSGSIEAEADMVCFLYREAYYKMKEAFNTEGAERPERQEMEETEIIVGKHRNGPTGMVKVGFMAEYAKFVDLDLTRTDEPTGF
jgi:replicative DNA helicase